MGKLHQSSSECELQTLMEGFGCIVHHFLLTRLLFRQVCNVHITLVQKTNDSNHVFLCGTHTKDHKTECCYMVGQRSQLAAGLVT